jgi:phosphoglucosamine mutase
LVAAPSQIRLAGSRMIGRAKRIDDADGRYIEAVKASVRGNLDLAGLKIVVDCANGAAYHVAPEALWELGADVVPIGVSPNGTNINDGCGSTNPQVLQETVVASGADIGLALDGDADRLIVADEKGTLVDGDQLMSLIALDRQRRGELGGGAVVATVMSNLGLERRLQEAGISLIRTKVGDRYVLEAMREKGCNIGGEQSGHIILTDHSTTGDGLVAALQVLAALVDNGKQASETLRQFEPVPQLLKNVRFQGGAPLEDERVKDRIAAAEQELNARGRLVIRKSGTEPVIRVMAEGDDQALVERLVDDICKAVQSAA